MSSKFNAASRAANIAARSIPIEYQEVKVPVPDEDFVNKFRSASGARTKTTNQWIIDVLPDFCPIMLFCIYHANQFIGSLDPRAHAKLSLATLTAYFMTIVYANFLVSDAFIRPTSSRFADELMSHESTRSYIYYLLNLPVPDFLLPILKYFAPSSTPRRPNVVFCPSANSFFHAYHFGRIFPINMFTNVHDFAANSNSRSNPDTVFFNLMSSPLFSTGPANNRTVFNTAQLLASLVPNSDTNPTVFTFLENKVNQSFRSLFNPVLLRAYQQKQTFAPINLDPAQFTSNNYNPYVMMLSMTNKNIFELKTYTTSISSTFKGIIKCSSDLAGIYSDYSGIQIFTHGYSSFPLPTWCANQATQEDEEFTNRVKPISTDVFAARIDFLQPHSFDDFSNIDSHYPTCNEDESHRITVTPDSVLIERDPLPDDAALEPKSVLEYDDDYNLYPEVRVLNPFEADTASAWLTTLCGMTIESEEIEASTVLQPNTLIELGVENAQFFGSAIPLKKIRKATSFKVHTQTENTRSLVTERFTFKADAPPAATMIRNPCSVGLPFQYAGAAYFGFPYLTPGLSPLRHVTIPTLTQTFFGFTANLKASRASKPYNRPAKTNDGLLLLFSPYLYLSPRLNTNWTDENANDVADCIFALSNLRTFFGTDASLIEVDGPLSAIPVY